MKSLISKQIIAVIESDELNNRLQSISNNYPNIKQEILIRNVILELYNKQFAQKYHRAFAEHPRDQKIRYDLGVVDLTTSINYKIELKYQYTKHRNSFDTFVESIEKTYTKRNSDMMILIVNKFDLKLKKQYDKDWSIKTSLDKYQSIEDIWKFNLDKSFIEVTQNDGSKYYKKNHSFLEPYPNNYYFYIIYKD